MHEGFGHFDRLTQGRVRLNEGIPNDGSLFRVELPEAHEAAAVEDGVIVEVGADAVLGRQSNEIAPELMASSKVVTDLTAQCETIGDLHHALATGARAYAELAEIVAGRKPGRESDAETIIFDSTGMALQDVAAAAIVYERAVAAGRGLEFAF